MAKPPTKKPTTAAPPTGTNVKIEAMKRQAGASRAVVLTSGAAQKSDFKFAKHVDPTGIRAKAAQARQAAPTQKPTAKPAAPAKTAVQTAQKSAAPTTNIRAKAAQVRQAAPTQKPVAKPAAPAKTAVKTAVKPKAKKM